MSSISKSVKTFIRLLLGYCFITILAVTLCETIAHAQVPETTTSVTDGRTPGALQPGSPAGSYPLSGFDNVNLFNGNLNFHLPLLQIGGRGSAQMTMNLALNLKSWHIEHHHKEMPDGNTIDTFKPTQLGWSPYGDYGAGRLNGRNYGLDATSNLTCKWYFKTLSRLTFSASDGTEYELRDQLTGGEPLTSTCTQGASRGTVFVTADGTAATFISDTTIYDNPAINLFGPHGFSVSGYLMFKDGTRYRIDNSNVTWIRDRNGNKISFTYSANSMTITDQLNRTVTVNYNVSDVAPYGLCDQIIYKGFGGTQRIVRVSHTSLSNALRPGSGYSIRTLGGSTGLFPETDGSTSTTYNPTVTSAVWLPDGVRSYKFYYNSYGELARVELPTGGAYEYDMTSGSGVVCPGVCWPGDERQIYRRVVERRVYSDGSTGASFEHKEVFTNTEAVGTDSATVTFEQFGPTGTVLGRSRHYFDGSALNSFFQTSAYSVWYEGTEKQTDLLDTAGSLASATVLMRTVTTRQQRAPVSWWHSGTYGYTVTKEPANDPRITDIVTTIEPATSNLVSKQTFGYDDTVPFNNRNNVKEYGFGSGTPGALQRETRTTYLTSSTYTGTTVHLRNLPTQVSVYDDSGAEKARSTIEYDNYVADTYHAGLVPRANASGFDSAFTTSYTTRGNTTASTNSVFVAGSINGSISAYSQFDITGNLVKRLDPRSTPSNVIATTLEYDDRYGSPDTEARSNSAPSELTGLSSFAFPTKLINALGHTSYTQFDYYLGQPINAENANGIVSSAYFNDQLDRPTQIRDATGTTLEKQITFTYDDTNRIVTRSSDKDSFGDNVLVNKSLYDQLGRTIQTRQYEGGSNYIVVETQYDALGRAYKTSNPYRPWEGQTALWTTKTFDALSRVTSITSPDNGVVSSSYSANTITVTDQSGKVRKTVADGLGRLIEVDEDPTGVNYRTTYLYDVLDNLLKVTQGSQQRFFMYDSLKRLIRSRNLEQSTNATLNLTDPITGNSAWSTAYQYDASGNLTQRTDARGVVSTYGYDSLNRNITIDYSDTASINPDVTRYYDGAVNGKGRFWYFYSGGDFSAGSNVEATAIDNYDLLGRPTVLRQLSKLNGTWGTTYQTTRVYNLAGSVISQTYPSGHTVSYVYDAAGRTSSFSGNLGDGTTRTYSTSIGYDPTGGIRQEQFGTQVPLYLKRHYNRRCQLFDIRLSTMPWATDQWNWNRGALVNYFSSNYAWEGDPSTPAGPDNNGNVLLQQHWVPGDDAISTFTYTQDFYAYDALNRIQSAAEYHGTQSSQSGQDFAQVFAYDRWGNRTINPSSWGAGINLKQFTVDAATNRLGVPVGQSGAMSYDNTGNLITDTYTGFGSRTYDAENRMTTAADNTGQTSHYTYDADGKRVRRQVGSSPEQWQIYGIDGELLGEYPANGPAASPQKEYGYRNGQLLVTAQASNNLHWLVSDHLGTPRIVLDQTGSLASTRRHDYLPFGEELFAPTGGRTTAQGYNGSDGVRQQFTQQERDAETRLDYFHARYYSSDQGRFTSIDPSRFSVLLHDPESWNRYSYAYNNPLASIDNNGKWPTAIHEQIVDRAFPGLSNKQRQEIKKGSYSVDDPLNGGQNSSHSNDHGMAMKGQSAEAAAEAAGRFMNENINAAKWNYAHHGLDSSLYDFGRAFHTLTDMTSPAHEGYQTWYPSQTYSHMKREEKINYYRMGLAVGASLSLYRYTYGQAELDRATGYTPGSENDPSVRAIEAEFSKPGSSATAEAEALNDYRRGLANGQNFDWSNQWGQRGEKKDK